MRAASGIWFEIYTPVSYTHLDVYKRQDVSGADTNKARGACATAPETPEPCGVSTGIPDTAPVPKAPAGTSGAVENLSLIHI